jgi:hypothetical protein
LEESAALDIGSLTTIKAHPLQPRPRESTTQPSEGEESNEEEEQVNEQMFDCKKKPREDKRVYIPGTSPLLRHKLCWRTPIAEPSRRKGR